MTLSDRERRILEYLEQTLSEDDPRLARLLRTGNVESATVSALLAVAVLALLAGACVLLTLGVRGHASGLAALGGVLAACLPFAIRAWARRRPGRHGG